MTTRRLIKEHKNIIKDPIPNVFFELTDKNDIHKWNFTLIGEEETLYSGGVFYFEVKVPEFYPFRPPKVRLKTKIFHPNFDEQGKICLGILSDQWAPRITIKKMVLMIMDLMKNPNMTKNVSLDFERLVLDKKGSYEDIARTWTRKYAR